MLESRWSLIRHFRSKAFQTFLLPLMRTPATKFGGWPRGFRCAVVLSFDVESWGGRCCKGLEPKIKDYEVVRFLLNLIELLDSYRVKAHFFIVGKSLEQYSSFFKGLVKDGHGIGGHGYEHEDMGLLTREDQERIIAKTKYVIKENLHIRIRGWRCPGLSLNFGTYCALKKLGIAYASHAKGPARPFYVSGVLEIPLGSRLDGDIYGYDVSRGGTPKDWLTYMKRDLSKAFQTGSALTLGMHGWVQYKYDPRLSVLKALLDYIDRRRDEIWITNLDEVAQHMGVRSSLET